MFETINEDPFDKESRTHLNPTNGKVIIDDEKKVVKSVIKNLSLKEQDVVRLYYYEDLTQREIGQQMGVSEARICQIHKEAKSKLRKSKELQKEFTSDYYDE